MEDQETSCYEVIITDPAEIGFYEILDFLYDKYSLERAEEIADEIRDTAKSLHYHAKRGVAEPGLKGKERNYRYIMYHRTKRAGVKVIYYIDEIRNQVFVTDFFPTEKDHREIPSRNQ